MYPYHNKIKQRIRNNELIRFEYVKKYKNISHCMLLHFNTEPTIRPIREHRFKEYEAMFDEQTKMLTNGNIEVNEVIPSGNVK